MTVAKAENFPRSVVASQQNGLANDFVLIGDAADRVGLEPKTIRFYEKVGLVNPARLGRLRIFSSENIETLQTVKRLRDFGFSIAETRALLVNLDCADAERRMSTLLRLRTSLQERLSSLSAKRDDLQKQIEELVLPNAGNESNLLA